MLVATTSLAGSLKVSIDPAYTVNQIGSSHMGYSIPSGRIIVDATELTNDVSISYLPVTLSVTGMYPTNLYICGIFGDNFSYWVRLGSNPSEVGPQILYSMYGDALVRHGTKYSYEIKSYVMDAAIGGSFSWGLVQPTDDYTGAVDALTGEIVPTVFVASSGQVISVVEQGFVDCESSGSGKIGTSTGVHSLIAQFDISVDQFEDVSVGTLGFRTSVSSTLAHASNLSNFILESAGNTVAKGIIHPELGYPEDGLDSIGISFDMSNVVWKAGSVHTLQVYADLAGLKVGDQLETYTFEWPTITGLKSGTMIFLWNMTISSAEVRSSGGKIVSIVPDPIGSTVTLTFAVLPDLKYHVERSSDLKAWFQVTTTVLSDPSGNIDWSDNVRPGQSFYRLKLTQ